MGEGKREGYLSASKEHSPEGVSLNEGKGREAENRLTLPSTLDTEENERENEKREREGERGMER